MQFSLISHQPGMAPMVFMNPNTDPASFGAKSWGFTMTALLWNPELAITQVEQKTANQKLPMSAGKLIYFHFHCYQFLFFCVPHTHDKKSKCLSAKANRFNYFPGMCDWVAFDQQLVGYFTTNQRRWYQKYPGHNVKYPVLDKQKYS